jgi:hypothetical protein
LPTGRDLGSGDVMRVCEVLGEPPRQTRGCAAGIDDKIGIVQDLNNARGGLNSDTRHARCVWRERQSHDTIALSDAYIFGAVE